jgi:glucose 1-dehydrogenase
VHAITVLPGTAGSAQLSDIAEPDPSEGAVLVDTLAVGVCGTDLEIMQGDYGEAPPGHARLVLGHESLGRVKDAPTGASVKAGDLVVAIVRRPDPVPCYACAKGEWDACRNGQYTEHGIKGLDGFMRERYRTDLDDLVVLEPTLDKVGVLLEPTTVVAKAWEQTLAIGAREAFEPKTALIVGAGPVGLLAAMIGRQQGLEVHVVDQVHDGLKPELVAALGATYHDGPLADAVTAPDIIIECTGVPALVAACLSLEGPGGVTCLTGISPINHPVTFDLGSVARQIVLGNRAVFGSVNANRRHYEAGAQALAKADRGWLEKVITRRVPITEFASALERQPSDVKAVIDLTL